MPFHVVPMQNTPLLPRNPLDSGLAGRVVVLPIGGMLAAP